MPKPAISFPNLLLVLISLSFLSANVTAQNWALKFSYANTKPFGNLGTDTFHGLTISVERKLFDRISTGFHFSGYPPADYVYSGGHVYSSRDEWISNAELYVTADIIKTKIADLYFKTSYGYIRQTKDGYRQTYADFPTDGPKWSYQDVYSNTLSRGIIVGPGIEIHIIDTLFIESSLTLFNEGYFGVLMGYKLTI